HQKRSGAVPRTIWFHAFDHNTRSASPETRRLSSWLYLRHSLCALGQRFKFCPGDLRMCSAAESAVYAGNNILGADHPNEAADALRHQFRMLDTVRGMRDHAWNQDFAFGQLHVLPNCVFVLVTRVCCLDEITLRSHPQHQVHQLVETYVV